MCGNLFIILIFTVTITLITALPHYTVDIERGEVVSFNASLVKKDIICSFRKLNRTHFAFNLSYTLLHDYLDEKLELKMHVDQKFAQYSNTGIQGTINLCHFYKKNYFGIRDDIARYGNLEGCKITAKRYYLKNYIPNTSLWPPYLIYGKFRINIGLVHQNMDLVFMDWYLTVSKLIN